MPWKLYGDERGLNEIVHLERLGDDDARKLIDKRHLKRILPMPRTVHLAVAAAQRAMAHAGNLGEGVDSGDVVGISVKAGDVVTKGQTLVEVETNKAVMDVPAPENGTVVAMNFKVGDKVKPGQVVISYEPGATASAPAPKPAAATAAAPAAPAPVVATRPAPAPARAS